MIIIETYYLIDYENVTSAGLAGCEKLNNLDHIVIFFTANAKKIDMTEIANHRAADLKMIEVPAGKQSVDIHISSYLGYITGKHENRECNVIIISKDTDFDNIIQFWKNNADIKASRAQQIKMSDTKQSILQQPAPAKSNAKKVSDAKKTKLNQETIQAAKNAGLDASAANTVAQLVMGLYGGEHMLANVHNKLRDKYANYIDIYNAIKPVLSKYAVPATENNKTASTKSKDKTTMNTTIMRLLSNAGYSNDIVTYVASTVVKNFGIKNGKQQTYRTIISKYGQVKGLNVYNHIRKHI